MRLEDKEKAYLCDMLDAALAVAEISFQKKHEEYLTNRMMRSAVAF